MKKYLLLIISLFIFTSNVSALDNDKNTTETKIEEKETITLDKEETKETNKEEKKIDKKKNNDKENVITTGEMPEEKKEIELLNRTDFDNLGVNKKWNITSKNESNVRKTPYVKNSKEYIYDFSDIYTPEEEEKMRKEIEEFRNKYNIEVIILTYNLPYSNDSANETFATDFYDYNDFGLDFGSFYDGVLFFRNTYDRDPYFDMYSFGEAQLYYTPDRLSSTLDFIYDDVHNARYYQAFKLMMNRLNIYHKEGKINGYKINEKNGGLEKVFSPNIFLIVVGSIIITALYISHNVKKNQMIRLRFDAKPYVENMNVTDKTDTFLTTYTTHWTESSSSGGGGGHSSFGSSGGGHSSGGGRHG